MKEGLSPEKVLKFARLRMVEGLGECRVTGDYVGGGAATATTPGNGSWPGNRRSSSPLQTSECVLRGRE